MNPAVHEFIQIDLSAMLAGIFAAVACGLLGNFLVLRRLSLMGDAISHAVLPGIVAAFIIARSRDPLLMLAGAAAAGVVTVIVVELIKRFGRVESGAAMGVTFSILFALGVVMIEQASRHVDLDPDCVLYGNLENVTWWGAPQEPGAYLRWETYRGTYLEPDAARGVWVSPTETAKGRYVNGIPPQVPILAAAVLVSAVFIVAFFKELRIAAFDPGLSSSLGFSAGWLHIALMIVVAVATVAAFEAVGSILVIAMLICPAATARLLTDRLAPQIVVSLVVAVLSAGFGYIVAAFGPGWLGYERAVNAAGMMAVMAGAVLTMTIVCSPSHGVVARWWRRFSLGVRVAREDLLGLLYRAEEVAGAEHAIDKSAARRALGARGRGLLALWAARRGGEIHESQDALHLTDKGRARARSIIRSHRLWESYLVRDVGLRSDHVHDTAMILEHLRDRHGRLQPLTPAVTTDPHERSIPTDDSP